MACLALGLFACESKPAERIGAAIRLTKGPWKEQQIHFHPTELKLLAIRELSEQSGTSAAGGWKRQVVEVDFSDPDRPGERVIDALEDGSFPSYAGDKGIVALDRRGRLVFLPAGADQPIEVDFPGQTFHPTKPVASPDGEYVAFLAAPPPAETPSEMAAVAPYRYRAYVAPLGDGKAEALEGAPDSQAMLVAVEWAGPAALFVFYQIADPKRTFTRVERIRWPERTHGLALFTDYGRGVAVESQARFFATIADAPDQIVFLSRGMDKKETVDLSAELSDVAIDPGGRWVAAVRTCDDVKGANLYLAPVPAAFAPIAFR
ncbi:MAG: hypothetical protein C4523_15590 [Myxococcales bacterium]|nr:MAG: hypothetical protein C4523_15590 [Myxococcales bacterium]